jgi:hypothetical protein
MARENSISKQTKFPRRQNIMFNRQVPILAILLVVLAFVVCGARIPPVLPTQTKGTAWGGSDTNRWRPESIIANAASVLLNAGWQTSNVTDVIVSMPVEMRSSDHHVYCDGQTNAATSFGSWGEKKPPVAAVLLHYQNKPATIVFQFHKSLPFSGEFEVYGDNKQLLVSMKSDKKMDQWIAVWIDVPNSLGLSKHPLSQLSLLVKLKGWKDWFPIRFFMAIHSTDTMVKSLPEAARKFSDNIEVIDHEGVSAQKPGSSQNPFDRLIAKTNNNQFTSFYNTQPYTPLNIHAEYPEYDGRKTVTAVGMGWTWLVKNPVPPLSKILYTCFDKRQIDKESEFGVPSGGGWHKIGDPAETIFNDLEAAPVVVGHATSNPYPWPLLGTGSFSYGLHDAIAIRWLHPGEAFVTRRGKTWSNNNGVQVDQSNFHWFMFQYDRPVCTEEWVHQCVPGDDYLVNNNCVPEDIQYC